MSALPDLLTRPDAADQYVVSFGKAGGLGVFTSDYPLALRRGDRVVIRSARGEEVGTVLCAASVRQARLLGAAAAGALLRPVTPDDNARLTQQREVARQLFDAARRQSAGVALEVLDVEVMFDGRVAIVQCVGDMANAELLVQRLEAEAGIAVRLEDLAAPTVGDDADAHGGCGEANCGRGGGGCDTCGTGGGCSSCGSKVDLRDYFAHLRGQMEHRARRPLA